MFAVFAKLMYFTNTVMLSILQCRRVHTAHKNETYRAYRVLWSFLWRLPRFVLCFFVLNTHLQPLQLASLIPDRSCSYCGLSVGPHTWLYYYTAPENNLSKLSLVASISCLHITEHPCRIWIYPYAQTLLVVPKRDHQPRAITVTLILFLHNGP